MVESRRAPAMMGQQSREESLFYSFRLEDQIPDTHLLRLIDRYVDFTFVRDRLQSFYSQTGRPSIDPETLLRLLLVGYLYGITSERRLLEDVRMHLAYRWFTRLARCIRTSSSKRRSRSEEHTSELQSRGHLVCRLLLEKKNIK